MKEVFTAAQRAELIKLIGENKSELKTFTEWLHTFSN